MRFTVKAKLASAFGAIIVLSMASGGIAFVKLNELSSASQVMAARAERMNKAGQLESLVQTQSRDEKNVILSTDEADISHFADEIKNLRSEATRTRDAIYANTDETGKALLTKFSGEYEKLNKIEDEVVRLGSLNSNDRAAVYWNGEGAPAIKALDEGVDASLAGLDRSASSPEIVSVSATLQSVKFEWEKAQEILAQFSAVTTVDEVNALSATSEELTAQAEQLQQTISYFRIGASRAQAPAAADATVDKAVSQLKGKASSMRSHETSKRHHIEVAHLAQTPAHNPSPRKVAAGAKGFALDLHTGEDETDAEFRRA